MKKLNKIGEGKEFKVIGDMLKSTENSLPNFNDIKKYDKLPDSNKLDTKQFYSLYKRMSDKTKELLINNIKEDSEKRITRYKKIPYDDYKYMNKDEFISVVLDLYKLSYSINLDDKYFGSVKGYGRGGFEEKKDELAELASIAYDNKHQLDINHYPSSGYGVDFKKMYNTLQEYKPENIVIDYEYNDKFKEMKIKVDNVYDEFRKLKDEITDYIYDGRNKDDDLKHAKSYSIIRKLGNSFHNDVQLSGLKNIMKDIEELIKQK